MRSNVSPPSVVRAVVKAIVAKFDRSDWMALALAVGQLDYVRNHPRLLRSLSWGDDDYEGHVIDAVPRMLGQTGAGKSAKFEFLDEVEEHTSLRSFLRENEAKLFVELYGGDDEEVIDDLQAASAALGLDDIDIHAARIRHGLREDPGLAIGSAKDLLETVLKAILGLTGNGPETRVDMPSLVKMTNQQLGLDAAGERGNEPGAEQRRRLFGSLSAIVNATGELRNAGFGVGHGGVARPELDIPTARLAVAAAVALATYYVEAHAASSLNA